MTRTVEHLADWYFGETIQFSVLGKTRGATAAARTALPSAASVTLRVRISATPGGTALLTFDTGDAQVTLGDAATARWDIELAPADYTGTLKEGRLYFVDVESEDAGGTIIHQKRATLTLQRSSA